jgi:hypothetical protein
METLMNFRIPEDLKQRFQASCAAQKSNMTAEINRFVQWFVTNAPAPKVMGTWLPREDYDRVR